MDGDPPPCPVFPKPSPNKEQLSGHDSDMFLSTFLSGDSTLYLAGGEFPDGSASREMWRYDPCFDSWMEMAPMNVARSELGKAVSELPASPRSASSSLTSTHLKYPVNRYTALESFPSDSFDARRHV